MKTKIHNHLCRTLAILAAGLLLGGLSGMSARADMFRMTNNYPAGTVAPYNAGGGVPAQPIITSQTITSTNATLCWYGMQGWYSIQGSTDLVNWAQMGNTVAASDFTWNQTVANTLGLSGSFRLAVNNSYAGPGACSGCHGAIYTPWSQTAHGSAISAILKPDGSFTSSHANPSCLLCHTVGYGQPTGYVYDTNNLAANYTSPLANVGCEDCHGPASWHKNSDHDLIRPAVSLDPTICGSCHQGHNPQYPEYATSAHAEPTTSHATSLSCGPCHQAATRMAMLNEYKDMLAGQPHTLDLPTSADAKAWTVACANCHDPHGLTPSPVFGYVTNIIPGVSTNTAMTPVAPNYVQLRNPLWSSNFYTMAPVSDGNNNTTFDTMYNPNVQICGQCHNTRGARWDGLAYAVLTTNVVSGPLTNTVYVDIWTTNTVTQVFTNSLGVPYLTNSYTYSYISGRTNTTVVTLVTNTVRYTGLSTNVDFSRGPHHSPQYNMLIGILQPDYLNTLDTRTVTNGLANNGLGIYATHSGIRPRSIYNTNQCATCHVPNYTGPNGIVSGHSFNIDPNGCALGGCHSSGAPDYVDYALENSNVVVSVADLLNTWATNTGPTLFTNYGNYLQNSWEYTTPGELASITNNGPSASDQLLLPDVIKQARFNIYMVDHDGTFEAHNPTFIPLLIKDAETKVLGQLPVQFTAKSTYGGPGATITFSNLTSGVSTAAWDFGDGGNSTSTAASVTHSYTNAGVYTVSLTVNGANTLTRNGYIHIYVVPTPSYTSSAAPTNHPVTMTFTNTSVNANYGSWVFYNPTGPITSTNRIGGKASPLGIPQFYTFTNTGNFRVVFTASSPGGGASVTNTIAVP